MRTTWRTLVVASVWMTASVTSCASRLHGEPLTKTQALELRTLVGQLSDPARSARTKVEAASLLLSRSYPQAAGTLKGFLNDTSNHGARIAVARAIAESGKGSAQFVEPLMKMLTGTDPKVRVPAAQALVTYKNAGVMDKLIRIVRSGKTGQAIRLAIIDAMQNMRDRRAVDALVGLLDDKNVAIRHAAVDSLARLTSIRAFGSDPKLWKQWWAKNRNKPRTVWLADLVNSLARSKATLESRNVQLRDRLARAMMDLYAATPAGAQEARLIGFLKDPLSEVRLVGALLVSRKLAAGQEIGKPLRGQIRSMLSDTDALVRRETTLLVASMRDEKALGTLLERMKVEKVAAVREAILKAMGQIADPRAFSAVLKEVRSKDGGIAREAARALGGLIAKNPLTPERNAKVARILKTRYEQVPTENSDGPAALREAILTAMGAMQDEALAGVLARALKDSAARVRLAAVNGLAQFRSASAGKIAPLVADPDRGVRQAAIVALGRLDGESYLKIILGRTEPSVEPDVGVRRQAWSVVMKILSRSHVAVIANVAGKLSKRPDAVDQYIGVLKMLVAAMKDTSGSALAGAQRRLGLALAHASRAAEACDHLASAYRLYAAGKNPAAAEVWLEWVDALLAADDPSVAGVLANQADGTLFAGAISHLQDRLAQMTKEGRFTAVIALSGETLARLSKRLTGAQKQSLERFRSDGRTRQAAADRKEVAKLAVQLTAADDSSNKASEKLQAMGPRAVKGLIEVLRNAVSSGKPNADLEKAILKVLAKIAPKLTGYDVKAAKNSKLKLIDAWLKGD